MLNYGRNRVVRIFQWRKVFWVGECFFFFRVFNPVSCAILEERDPNDEGGLFLSASLVSYSMYRVCVSAVSFLSLSHLICLFLKYHRSSIFQLCSWFWNYWHAWYTGNPAHPNYDVLFHKLETRLKIKSQYVWLYSATHCKCLVIFPLFAWRGNRHGHPKLFLINTTSFVWTYLFAFHFNPFPRYNLNENFLSYYIYIYIYILLYSPLRMFYLKIHIRTHRKMNLRQRAYLILQISTSLSFSCILLYVLVLFVHS